MSKNCKIHVTASIAIKSFGGISSCNGGKLEKSEVCICVFVVSCILESEKILLTEDLSLNISLVVGQSSLHILLVLRIRDIYPLHDIPPNSDILGYKSLQARN